MSEEGPTLETSKFVLKYCSDLRLPRYYHSSLLGSISEKQWYNFKITISRLCLQHKTHINLPKIPHYTPVLTKLQMIYSA